MKILHRMMSQQRNRVGVHFSQQIIIGLKRVTRSITILKGHIVGGQPVKEHVDEGGGISVGEFTWGLVRHGLKEIEKLGGNGDSPLFSQHNLH